MKRRWRLGRVVMGVVLLGIAGLAYWIWPGVSWKIEGEKAIGFDVAKGLVYTVKSEEGKHELRGYDLWSGERRFTMQLQPETDENDTGSIIIVRSKTSTETMKEISEMWKWHLLPEKEKLIAVNPFQTTVQLIDFTTGKVIGKLKDDKLSLSSLSDHTGYSRDGRLFAVHNGVTDDIMIWNLATRKAIDVVSQKNQGFGSKLVGISRDYFRPEIELVDGNIAYSHDAKSLIQNFVNKKIVLEHPGLCRPRFLNDGQLILFTPVRIDNAHQPAWYRRDADDVWQRKTMEPAKVTSECYFVCYTDNLLVTDCSAMREKERPEWVPVGMWGWTNQRFGFNGVRRHLQFWDLQNGQLVREYRFFEPTTRFGDRLDGLEKRVFISEDGRWLARESDDELIVCDTLERRTVYSWAVVIGLVSLAAWYVWPRRVQLTQS